MLWETNSTLCVGLSSPFVKGQLLTSMGLGTNMDTIGGSPLLAAVEWFARLGDGTRPIGGGCTLIPA